MVNLDEYPDGTLFLKKKTLKKTKGENKGDEFDVFEGSIHIGSGKFIAVSTFSCEVVEFEDKKGNDVEGIFLNIRKWKGDKPSTKSKAKKAGW